MIQNMAYLFIIVIIGYMAFNVYSSLETVIDQRNNQLKQIEQQLEEN